VAQASRWRPRRRLWWRSKPFFTIRRIHQPFSFLYSGEIRFGVAVQLLGKAVDVKPAVPAEVGRLGLAAAMVAEGKYL